LEVTTAGTFTVTVTGSNGCSATAQVTTTLDDTLPTVAIVNKNGLALSCTVPNTMLTASGGVSYSWSDGTNIVSTEATLEVTTAGTFTVTVTGSNGCSATDEVTITLDDTPEEFTASSIDICVEDEKLDLTTLLIDDFISGGTWTDDMNSGGLDGDIFDPLIVNLGEYSFTYTESGLCGRIITVFVSVNDDCVVLPCSTEDVIISKVVTANNDGYNDVFEITGLDGCGFTFAVKIFNRWGKMVYWSDNYQNNWKGYHDNSGLTIGTNSKLPKGTYYYVVNILNSGIKPLTGYIYLGTH